MIQSLSRVLRNEMIAPNYGRLALACGGPFGRSKPGQFVMLGFPGSIDPLLRRPFSIHGLVVDAGHMRGIELLYKTIGPATRRMAGLKPDDTVSLMGPLGSAFLIPSGTRRIYLAGGGVGVARSRSWSSGCAAWNTRRPCIFSWAAAAARNSCASRISNGAGCLWS